MRVAYKNCNHDQLPELPNFKSRTQRMNMEKSRHMKPAEFASLLCEKLEKLKIDNEEESRKSDSQVPTVHDQRLSSPYHHGHDINMALPPSYYPADEYFDDSQSWIMPPASDRYSVAGASSHSGSGVNAEKNRNIKEKAKELRNTVHHYLRNGLGECECPSCNLMRQEKAYQMKCTQDLSKLSSEYRKDVSKHSSEYSKDLPKYSSEYYKDLPKHAPEYCKDLSKHSSEYYKDLSKHSSEYCKDLSKHSSEYRKDVSKHSSEYCKDVSKHSSEYSHRIPGNPACCCNGKDCTNHTHHPVYRKYNSEESSHRTVDYAHENTNEDCLPPIDNTKIYAWMERNDRLKHTYPTHSPSPANRRKKQTKGVERNTAAQTVQPIAQDLGMPLLPHPDTGNVLEEVKRVLEEPEQRLSPVKKMPSRTHQPPTQQQQQQYHNVDHHTTYSDNSYEKAGSMSTANWSLSDTHSRSSHNPSQISTVPSSASRLWNPEGYYDSSSDVRLENKSGASRSHSTGTGRHSQHHANRSDHRSNNTRSDNHNDMRSQRTDRSHGSDSNKTQTTTVTYYFGVDPIPFRISVPSEEVTLGQFSKSLTKKGNFRFFFKTISKDDGEVVYEEVRDENEVLPRFKDKIIGKVEKIE